MARVFGLRILALALSIGNAHSLRSFDDVRRAVDANVVRSVDDLWHRLPPEMHRAPALVYAGASSTPSAPPAPRVLVATDDARLFAAVATQPDHPAFEQIEFASSDPVTDELTLHLIDFRQTPVVRSNPPECMACHMVNGVVRLRVDPYPHWPGWFGSAERAHDYAQAHVSAAEARALKLFLSANAHPRLRHSDLNRASLPEDLAVTATRLTSLAAIAEARAARRALMKHPHFERIKLPLILGTNAAEIKRRLEPDLAREFAAQTERLTAELETAHVARVRQMNTAFRRISGGQWLVNDPNYGPAVGLEWALRGAGSSLASFSTLATPGVHDLNGGVDGSVSFLVRYLLADDVINDHGLDTPTGFTSTRVRGFWMLKRRTGLRQIREALGPKTCGRDLVN